MVNKDLASGTPYTFSFQITNPSLARASPPITIEAAGVRPSLTVMTKLDTIVSGVQSGSHPFLVHVPAFVNVSSIGQSNSAVVMVVQMMVTLSEFDKAMQVFLTSVFCHIVW